MKRITIFIGISLLIGCSGAFKSEEEHVKPFKHDSTIEISYAGDAMMDWSVKQTMEQKGVNYPFKEITPAIKKADFSIVNIETAITTKGTPYPKQFNFRSNPSSIKGLKQAGFDLVSLANNHSMDYGTEGLVDTMDYLKQQNLPYIGAGADDKEAYQAFHKKINGKIISFLAFSRVLPDGVWFSGPNKIGIANAYEENKVIKTIEREQKVADYVFIYIHWGIEKNNQPEEYQRVLAKKMINAGADAIIGSHPHVLQGFEYYKGKPIAYSIGNFLFPNYITGKATETGLLTICIKNNHLSMKFQPYEISQNQIIKKDQAYDTKQMNYLQQLSPNTTIKGTVILPKKTRE